MASVDGRSERSWADRGSSRILSAAALLAAALAVLAVVATSGGHQTTTSAVTHGSPGGSPGSNSGGTPAGTTTTVAGGTTTTGSTTASSTNTTSSAPSSLSLAHALGQMIVTGFAGKVPSANLLARIREGEIGGVILFSANTAGGDQGTITLIDELQSAAIQGNQPGLLVMTDQEGGEVKRLPGPPDYSAAQMTSASLAGQQGHLTGQYLRQIGVNVDLAPVSDVNRTTKGFLATEQRTFGDTATQVALRACAFADGLASAGVAPTLKHFPGLGLAVTSTDTAPVMINASAAAIRGDDLVYRECGQQRTTPALVMVSSAIYPTVTGGDLPAVLSPEIYNTELPKIDHLYVVTISDDLGAGALLNIPSPAAHAIDAGLDLLLYASDGNVSDYSYHVLLGEAEHGQLSQSKIQAAAAAILQLKRGLHLAT